ncbi:hypothetical protein GH714_006076 [Hevea brasiliensis]|uniref:Uncharacterized protein n=1 Tax=Hevea brasiliensis TaxID=3981 RepID=A0A6A6MBV8_HEVBR|nr:hypothetical protein GH714_006076 [Hevea brasiliensis]
MAVVHDNKDSFIFKLTKDCLSNWELPNDVLQLLNMVLLDAVVLHVGRPQPHQWTIGIGRGENGNMVQFKESDLVGVISHYSSLTTSSIDIVYFKEIKSDSLRLYLFNSDGEEISYGPHPVEDLVYISSNDEYEGMKTYKAESGDGGNTAFFYAAISGNVKIAQIMLKKDRNLAMIPVSENVLLIHIAALLGHGKMVRCLYEETKYQLQNIEIVDLTAFLWP